MPGLLARLLGAEDPEPKDPIDTPLPLAETYEPRDLGRIEFSTMRRTTKNFTHKHHDGFGDPLHDWKEKRVTAIRRECRECGKVQFTANRRGVLKGEKRGAYSRG